MNSRVRCQFVILLSAVVQIVWGVAGAHGQAARDPKLQGTYLAAITGHSFPAPFAGGPVYNISGGLFSFYLGYDSLGFMDGVFDRGIAFIDGEKITIDGSLLVPPFPSANNRNLDFTISLDLPDEDIDLARVQFTAKYVAKGTMVYGAPSASYLRVGRLSHQAVGVIADQNWERFIQGGGALYGTVTSTPFDIEATKVSDQFVVGFRPKVKIRR